jgi:hypothetical protein
VHISHGLRKTVDGGQDDGVWPSIEAFVSVCLTYGVQAAFCQLGPDCPDPGWAKHTCQLRDALAQHGIPTGGWGRGDYADWEQVKAMIRSVMPLAGFLVDVEQRCKDPQLPEHLVEEFADEMPLGVIATGGIDDSFGTGAIDAAKRWGDYFDFVGQDYYKQPSLPLTPDSGENFVYWRSTAKNNGKGFRHLPEAGGRWHVPVVMPNAEGCPPLAAHVEWLKPYAPHFGVWDAELIDGGGEWPVFASI